MTKTDPSYIVVYTTDAEPFSIRLSSEDYPAVSSRQWYIPMSSEEVKLWEDGKSTKKPFVKQRGANKIKHPLHTFIKTLVEQECNIKFPKGTRIHFNGGWDDHRRQFLYLPGQQSSLAEVAGKHTKEPVSVQKSENGEPDEFQKFLIDELACQALIAYEDGDNDKAISIVLDAQNIHPSYIFTALAESFPWK